MAQVKLAQVVKTYGDLEVIHGADLTIEDGEFAVLVGPSGCGKSTLLRLISGLEAITSGELMIGGRVMNNVHACERGVAMVFQSYALYPHLTARGNMEFGLKIQGLSKEARQVRVQQAAEILQITDLLDRKPKAMSGGQRQRVAIGRAIVRDPECFLFDEPLSNLDAKLRVQMRQELTELHQRLKTTMIYVTHDQVEAMTMADKIIVLQSGHIEQVGTPMALYHRPDNRFVAGFIGSPAMNFIEVSASVKGRTASLTLPGGAQLDVPLKAALDGFKGQLTLGIRPEHLVLSARAKATKPDRGLAGAPLTEATLMGTVRMIERLGAESFAYLRCEGVDVTMKSTGDAALEIGQEVTLTIAARQVHLFDDRGQTLTKGTG